MARFLHQIFICCIYFFSMCYASSSELPQKTTQEEWTNIVEFYQSKFAQKNLTIKNLIEASLLKLRNELGIEKITADYNFDKNPENLQSSYVFNQTRKFYVEKIEYYMNAELYKNDYSMDMIQTSVAYILNEDVKAEIIFNSQEQSCGAFSCKDHVVHLIYINLIVGSALEKFGQCYKNPCVSVCKLKDRRVWPRNIHNMFNKSIKSEDQMEHSEVLFQIALEYAEKKFKTLSKSWEYLQSEHHAIITFYLLGVELLKIIDPPLQQKCLEVLCHLATNHAFESYDFILEKTKEFGPLVAALLRFVDLVHQKELNDEVCKKLDNYTSYVERQLEKEFCEAQVYKEQIIDYYLAAWKKSLRARHVARLYNLASSGYDKLCKQQAVEFLNIPKLLLSKQAEETKSKISEESDKAFLKICEKAQQEQCESLSLEKRKQIQNLQVKERKVLENNFRKLELDRMCLANQIFQFLTEHKKIENSELKERDDIDQKEVQANFNLSKYKLYLIARQSKEQFASNIAQEVIQKTTEDFNATVGQGRIDESGPRREIVISAMPGLDGRIVQVKRYNPYFNVF